MKKIWKWIARNKDYFAWAAHALWLSANIVKPDMANNNEQIIGHTIIGGFTGKGVYDRAVRNKKSINKNIEKAKGVFRKTPIKQN